ncbi:MAG: phytanoyl-CoA dioxygenase family protein [Burkholderiaceae bacterium]|nr:phytanoyl-CoA dioxygenase family protein [Burkholderiaceae bacterium]
MLTAAQKKNFREQGFITLPSLLSLDEVATLKKETDRIFTLNRPEVIRTEDGQPRVAMAMHWYSDVFAKLLHHPKVHEVFHDLIDEPYYCHQYKIVTKHPFGSLALPWHQDYGTWIDVDGMPEPRALTLGLFLEDVTEFNGALAFIPKSHHTTAVDVRDDVYANKSVKSVNLGPNSLTPLMAQNGIVAPKGPAGTAIIFDSRTAHGSGPNLSSEWRHIVYISPNPVSNKLRDPKRDEMFALRDYAPLQPQEGITL